MVQGCGTGVWYRGVVNLLKSTFDGGGVGWGGVWLREWIIVDTIKAEDS